MPALWPHQSQAVEDVEAAVAQGEQCICLCSPTGGGKSRIATALIERWSEQGHRTVVYTHRRLLVEQLQQVLTLEGIEHGVRAAGHEDNRHREVQIASLPTENARSLKSKVWKLHDAQRVVVDECHLHTGKIARQILGLHARAGAAVVGMTATPLGLLGMYDHLIIAGTNSELRECGALVWCHHYGCGGPDLARFKAEKKKAAALRAKLNEGTDLTPAEQRDLIMTPRIMGDVLDNYRRLNPEGKPTILFAPGVGESLWFAEQFHKNGITAAHIDGQEVWINGRSYRTSPEARADALAGSRSGDLRVLCNRFVLREGVDAPWLAHGIFAAVFGGLQSYLQSGGRLLRACPGLGAVTLQDHGDNWLLHGSLNADRHWELWYTGAIAAGIRRDRLRSRGADAEREPRCCPRCGLVIAGGRCGGCGYELPPGRYSRPVIAQDGTLREQEGQAFRPRRISKKPNGPALWKRMYWRSRTGKGEKTFRGAFALFAQENDWGYPDPAWPWMPRDTEDHFRLVGDVPPHRLVGYCGVCSSLPCHCAEKLP